VSGLGPIPKMVSVAAVAMWFVAVNGVVCAQQQGSGAADEKTVLRGTVVNSVTHQPVGRAVVMSSDGRFATMTNERGRFEMVFKVNKSAPAASGAQAGAATTSTFSRTVVTSDENGTTTSTTGPGVLEPMSDRPDYLTAKRTGFINGAMHGQSGVPIARYQEEVTIPLTPESRIIGHVTLADGEGARGMQVALYRRGMRGGRAQWLPSGQAEVKSDGEFRVADLQAGDYKLLSLELNDQDPVTSNPRGEQFGYPPDYYPGAPDFAAAALIHLAAGETFQASLTPERRHYYPIHIGLLNGPQRGGVVPQVEVWKDGHAGPGYSLGYDFRDGSIAGSLPDGNYLVKVTSPSEDALTGVTTLSVKGGPTGGMVTLLGGAVVGVQVNEEFSNTQEPRSIVTVGDPQGRPRHGQSVQVRLWPIDDFTFRQLMARPPSDPEAEGLEIPNVPAGEYRVQVDAFNGYVASMRCGGTDLQKSNLVVTAGGTLPPIEIVVRDDGGEIDGTVKEIASRNEANPQGAALAAGYVYFVPEGEGAEVKQTFAQRNGEFQMTQLAPGTYRVVAFETSRLDVDWSSEEAMKKFEVQTVTVVAGQKEKVRISLSVE
jgi:hypothetical protein